MPERREHKAKTSSRGGTFGDHWYDTEFRAWRKDLRKSQQRQWKRRVDSHSCTLTILAKTDRRINKDRRQ